MPGGNNGALRQYGRRAMPVIHAAEGHACHSRRGGPCGAGAVRRENTLSVNQQKSVR